MKPSGTIVGIVAAIGISTTAAIALPLVNVFQALSTQELMIVRGGVSAVVTATLFRRRISYATDRVILFSFLFGLANLSLYNSIRAWGVNPTIVILTSTPMVNIAAKRWKGEAVAGSCELRNSTFG